MPSPARSPIGKDQNDVDDYEDNGVDDRRILLEDQGQVDEFRRIPGTDTAPCYTKWFGRKTSDASKKTGNVKTTRFHLSNSYSLSPWKQFIQFEIFQMLNISLTNIWVFAF